MQSVDVPLAAINVSRLNTRKDLAQGAEDTSLEDLAQSIAKQGLISPPVLRRIGTDHFEVIAGQRRVLACQKLGWKTITAFVRDDLTDDDAVALSLVENVQRADMSPLDKARAYQALKSQYGNAAIVSRMTGVSEATIKKYLNLLQLPIELQNRVTTGNGPAGIGVMAQLATTFEDTEQMQTAWDKVSGFNSQVALQIIRRSGGELKDVEELVGRAIEGEFDRKACGSSLDTCPYVPKGLRVEVAALVARASPPDDLR